MSDSTERALGAQTWRFTGLAVVLTAGFGSPLLLLLRFASKNDFLSYIPLVPFITGYFIWTERSKLPRTTIPCWLGAIIAAVVGAALLGIDAWVSRAGARLEISSYLALMTASYLCLMLAGAFYFLGLPVLRLLAFPVGFLVFFIPPPKFVLDPIVAFFQQTSAVTAVAMIKTVGTPVISDGNYLQVPGILLHVAPECSGIHSTMVLLMTSFLAGYMFLQTSWRRAVMILIVVPLAILRNGFRIFVIAELCVHVGPDMIDSPIHHHGGPIFFILSLFPFFWLLLYLRKSEAPKRAPAPPQPAVSTTL